MKGLLFTVILITSTFSTVFSTEQVADRLIIGTDTVMLKSFPLDDLRLPPPFKYGKYTFPSTACWRGYMATWKVVESRLMLIEVEKMDSTEEKLDILQYFTSNGYEPEIIDGLVFAKWYSAKLIIYDYSYHKYSGLYLFNAFHPYLLENEVPLLEFENGFLTNNRIRSMDSFHIGDTITKQVTYNRLWFQKDGTANVSAVIVDKKRNMVKIDVLSYGIDKKRYLDDVKKKIVGYWKENYWVNPLYWKN